MTVPSCYKNQGSIESCHVLYVNTGVAYPYQVQDAFDTLIRKAKDMPEVFGLGLECDAKVTVVKNNNGEYLGYGYVDLDNPKVYHALLGREPTGEERVVYKDASYKLPGIGVPEVKCRPKPYIQLSPVVFTEEQRLATGQDQGELVVHPSYLTLNTRPELDNKVLHATGFVSKDYKFAKTLFDRYGRTGKPHISMGKSATGGYYALVKYQHEYDAGYALQLLRGVTVLYHNQEIRIRTRYAKKRN